MFNVTCSELELTISKATCFECDIISLEAGNCRNGNRVNVRASENGKCNTRSLYGKNYQTKNTKVKFNGRNTITGPGVRMFTPGFWRYGWYHHQKGAGGCNRGGRCRSWNGCGNYGGYLNAYLTFKAPRDGRTKSYVKLIVSDRHKFV